MAVYAPPECKDRVHQGVVGLQATNLELRRENRKLQEKCGEEHRTSINALFTMNHAKEGRKQALVQTSFACAVCLHAAVLAQAAADSVLFVKANSKSLAPPVP